jgi:hypothetical protein
VSRPRAPGQRAVDDRDRRSIALVPDRKEAASEQRRPDGLEEILARLVRSQTQALGNRCVIPFDSEDLFPGIRDEQIADDAGVLHTRNRLNLFEDAGVQVGPLRRDVQSGWRGEFHHQDPLRPESRIDAVHIPPASDEQAGADEEDDGERKLRHDKRAADSTGGGCARDTSAALLAGGTPIAAQGRDRGGQSHQNSREYRDGQGPSEDADIEAHFVQTRQVTGPEGADEANAYHGEQCANQSRNSGEQDAFGEKLSHDSSRTRSKRSANGHLPRPGDATRQRQAGDIGCGDQEHQKHGAAEHPQCQSRLCSDRVQTQWDDADASIPFGRGQLIVEAMGDCGHLRLGLCERYGWSKPSNHEPRVSDTDVLRGASILKSRVRLPHVCLESRDLETRGQDAEDLGRNAVDHDGRANRILRASETRLPEAMTDEDELLALLRFLSRKAASHHGLHAEK